MAMVLGGHDGAVEEDNGHDEVVVPLRENHLPDPGAGLHESFDVSIEAMVNPLIQLATA